MREVCLNSKLWSMGISGIFDAILYPYWYMTHEDQNIRQVYTIGGLIKVIF